jgi:Arc/MetJ family transcription regulator
MTDVPIRRTAEPEIDAELLEEAQRQLGGQSPNAAINAALRLFVDQQRDRRGRAFDRLQEMADAGGFDFTRIEEADR